MSKETRRRTHSAGSSYVADFGEGGQWALDFSKWVRRATGKATAPKGEGDGIRPAGEPPDTGRVSPSAAAAEKAGDLKSIRQELFALVDSTIDSLRLVTPPATTQQLHRANDMVAGTLHKLEQGYEKFTSITTELRSLRPEFADELNENLEKFRLLVNQQTQELERQREELKFQPEIPPPGEVRAQGKYQDEDGVVRSAQFTLPTELTNELDDQAAPTACDAERAKPAPPGRTLGNSRPGSNASSNSSLLEVELAGAEAAAEVTDEMTALMARELKAKHEAEMLALERTRLESRGKVKVLERKVAAERSIRGSLAGEDHTREDPPARQRHPDVVEKMATHGAAAAKVWLTVNYDYTEAQIEEIMQEIREDQDRAIRQEHQRSSRSSPCPTEMQIPVDKRGRPVTASTREARMKLDEDFARTLQQADWDLSPSRSPRGSILGTDRSRGYGARQERRAARTEEGPWPGSGVRFQAAEPAVAPHTPRGAATKDASWILLRDKLISPPAGADIFTGDRSKFLNWWHGLQDEFEEMDPPLGYADKIRALRARTAGKPRKCVDNFASTHPGKQEEAFRVIKAALHRRFGSAPEIAKATRDKIAAWKPVKASDPEALRDLADECSCVAFTISYTPELSDLNSSHGLDGVRLLLPYDLQRKWATAGTQYKRQHDGNHPTFNYFSEWLDQQADIACDPHFRIDYGRNDKDKKDQKSNKNDKDSRPTSRTLLTDSSQSQPGREASKEQGQEASKKTGPPQGSSATSKKTGGNPAEKKEEGKGTGGAPAQGSGGEPDKKCIYHGMCLHTTEECHVLKRFKDLSSKPELRKDLGLEQ